MAALAALFRGVNVGGNHRIKMEALRRVFGSLGLAGAQTYLQSGNVVFHSAERSLDKLSRQIEDGFQEAFGFRSAVVLRTATAMRKVIEANPHASRPDLDRAKLLVLFLAKDLPQAEMDAIKGLTPGPEELTVTRSEIYIYYPEGMGRSKLDGRLGKVMKTTATGRNWNSVVNIWGLMDEGESGLLPLKG